MHIGNQRSQGRPIPNACSTVSGILEPSTVSRSLTARWFSATAILIPSSDEAPCDGSYTIRGIG